MMVSKLVLTLAAHRMDVLRMSVGLKMVALKEQSRPSVSNITSADIRLTTPLNSATSLVNVTKSV